MEGAVVIEFSSYRGAEIEPRLEELAALRIQVFREFPYLYEGTLEYEREYLKVLATSSSSLLVIARHQDVAVGASTAIPLSDEGPEFREPFERAGLPPQQYYYFGESVLLAPYRGRGVGHRFFDLRERQARELGYRYACFCRVLRAEDHPRRPVDYRPLDGFWSARGYQRRPELLTGYSWPDLGESRDSEKSMEFWIKELSLGLSDLS